MENAGDVQRILLRAGPSRCHRLYPAEWAGTGGWMSSPRFIPRAAEGPCIPKPQLRLVVLGCSATSRMQSIGLRSSEPNESLEISPIQKGKLRLRGRGLLKTMQQTRHSGTCL